ERGDLMPARTSLTNQCPPGAAARTKNQQSHACSPLRCSYGGDPSPRRFVTVSLRTADVQYISVPFSSALRRSERDSAQHFPESAFALRGEAFSGRRPCRRERVGDDDELVGVSALITVAAYGRRDCPDGDRSIAVHAAGNVAESVGGGIPRQTRRRIVPRRVIRDRVRSAEIQAGLQRVLHLPHLRARVAGPFLHPCRLLRVGLGVVPLRD